MNLLHLHYFYVVAKEQGFTRASKKLRIQQPAISRMVRLLEDDLGFPVFEKIGRNVRLTLKGQEVFEHSQRIFASVDELKNSLGQIDGTPKGPLLMGASEPIASHFVPKILKVLVTKYPLIYPNIFSGTATDLFEKLIKGSLEFGMFFHIPEIPPALEIFKTIDVRYHLVVKKSLRKNKVTLQKFIGSREIDDTQTKRFPTLERLRKDHPEATIRISSNNLTAHRTLVLEGLGVSILPDFLVAQDIKAGRLASVYPQEDFLFKLKFLKRKKAVFSLGANKFIELCK